MILLSSPLKNDPLETTVSIFCFLEIEIFTTKTVNSKSLKKICRQLLSTMNVLNVNQQFHILLRKSVCQRQNCKQIPRKNGLQIWSPGFLPGLFFRGGGAKSIIMQISFVTVFGPNFGEGQSLRGGQTASEGPPPCGRKPESP